MTWAQKISFYAHLGGSILRRLTNPISQTFIASTTEDSLLLLVSCESTNKIHGSEILTMDILLLFQNLST
jgi:hypothetical protein